MLALSLDLFKGVPAVYAADKFYHLPESQLLFIAFTAILGHAFSPLLRLHGGKAVATTFGALNGLGRPDMLFPFAVAALIGFILLQNHSWVVLVAAASDLVYVLLHGSGTGPLLFMTGVLLLYIFKHFRELNGWPRPKAWLYRWLQSRRQI
jgi:glycerol-3-phosphate acyltransferase PlsY